MSSIADRIRARRQEMANSAPQPQIPTEVRPDTTPVSESLAVQSNSQPNPRAGLTTLSTTLTQGLTDGLTLEERTVRFFTVITQGMPYVGDNPVMRQLLRALGPLLTNELAKMDHEELERVYQSMLCALGQVYAPGATHIVVDLQKQHVLIEEVAIATNRPELLAAAEFDALPAPTDVELDEAASAPEPLKGEVLVPAPPRDMARSDDDDDPLVGVEIDGVTYAVKQSEANALRAARAS